MVIQLCGAPGTIVVQYLFLPLIKMCYSERGVLARLNFFQHYAWIRDFFLSPFHLLTGFAAGMDF